MPLAAGTVFAGYRIDRLLGSGAMGEVYLAEHPRLPRRDALKILSADLTADAEFRERFRREADLAATLFHPGVVGIHDRGECDGRLWLAMDYVEGTDAARLLAEHPGGLEVAEAVQIVTAIAAALDYAHQRGLLHRDVKPANILLTAGDPEHRRILLADFGIARPLGEVSGLTATNFTLGTLAYAAPEQLMGVDLDGRADQYALAATAFQLLTGAPPYRDANPVALISRQLSADPPAVSEFRPGLGALDAVLRRALAKDPAERFDDCLGFARALAAPTGGATVAAPVAGAPGARPAGWVARHRGRLAAAVTATAGLAGGIGLLGGHGEQAPPSAPAPTTTVTAAADPECATQRWPQRLPNLIGKPLGVIRTESLKCFNVTAATAPDGHDVLDDPIGAARAWTIVGATPAAGTEVTGDRPITLSVAPLQPATESAVAPEPEPAPDSPAPTAAMPSTAAPPPAVAPAIPDGASAQCADGTFSFSRHRSGTCAGHDGVARWLTPLP